MYVHKECHLQFAVATRYKPGFVSWYECSICKMHLRSNLSLWLAESWVELTSNKPASSFERQASGLNLGRQLIVHGQYVQAEVLLRTTHARASIDHGLESEFTLSIAGEITEALAAQLKTEDALLFARAVYEARTRTLKRDHHDVMRITERLGHLLTQLRRHDEAMVFRVSTYDAHMRVFGPTDISTLKAEAFADTTRAILRLTTDDRAHRALLAAQTQAYGAEHAETLVTIQMLANILSLFGSFKEAHRILDEAYPVMCRIFGVSNATTLHAKLTIDSLSDTRCYRPSCRAVLDLKQHKNICSGCRRVLYCNKECQRSDWKRHKPVCIVIASLK